MASDPLGLFKLEASIPFVFAIFKDTRGLNFLEDCSLFNNPTEDHKLIGPRALVDWSDK